MIDQETLNNLINYIMIVMIIFLSMLYVIVLK